MSQPTGVSGADPNAQSGEGSTGQTVTTPPDGTGASGTPTEPAAAGTSSGRVYTEAEYQALQARMQAADRRAGEHENALKQLRDKDMPEIQRLQRDLTDTQARVTQLEADNSTLRVENGFLKDNTHSWHSPEAALQLLDRSRIQVDAATGTVTGMKDALKALAQANPFLLKPDAATPPTPPPPGTAPTNGGIAPGGNPATPNVNELAKRFPALRTRIGS